MVGSVATSAADTLTQWPDSRARASVTFGAAAAKAVLKARKTAVGIVTKGVPESTMASALYSEDGTPIDLPSTSVSSASMRQKSRAVTLTVASVDGSPYGERPPRVSEPPSPFSAKQWLKTAALFDSAAYCCHSGVARDDASEEKAKPATPCGGSYPPRRPSTWALRRLPALVCGPKSRAKVAPKVDWAMVVLLPAALPRVRVVVPLTFSRVMLPP
mmetsp:Transcript_825/g.2505  ORF Transcript_825/g.2505 Transcript_825/m.2505 type:complete len:216 (+) Transcript_825:972-1619(+)